MTKPKLTIKLKNGTKHTFTFDTPQDAAEAYTLLKLKNKNE